jgi:ammonium transporter Rh
MQKQGAPNCLRKSDFSILIRGKIEVGDIANASLAGGVAIGASVANVTPGWSMLIGLIAGTISVFGYTIV